MWSRNSFAACLLLALATSAFAQGASPAILGWDENGNLVSKTVGDTTWTYVYDADDELREVRRDGLLLETFQYDAQGHRVRRSGAGGTVRYVWDGDYVLQTTDDFGNTISRFVYAGKRLVSIEHSTEGLGFYLFDGLGSVSAVSKADGSIAARYGYDAWGNLKRNLGASSNSFLFTGHEFDEATGLYYAKGRYLDSELGRFLSEDSNPGNPLDPLSFHRYSYAASNPTRFVDPDGREAMEVSASGNVRDLDGNQLLQLLVHQEGLGIKEASRIVVLSGLGDDIGADRTAALAPAIAAAGELTGILPAERALSNPYMQGGLQVAGGTAEVALAVASASTGVGAAVSPVLAAHGGDSIGTGIRTLTSGNAQETLTHRGLRATAESVGAEPSTANFAADIVEIGLVGTSATIAAGAFPSGPSSYFEGLQPSELTPPRSMVVVESSSGGVELAPSEASRRPTWQESEAHASRQLEGFGFRDQVSYLNGEEVRRGLRDSVRPDEASQLMQLSVDVKNYDLTTAKGRNSLVRNVLGQLNSRADNLPSGMRQGLILDARGQVIDPKLLQDLVDRISTRSNSAILPENIHVEQ